MSSRYAFLLGAALSLGVAGSLAAQTGSTTGTTTQDPSSSQQSGSTMSSSQAGTESTMSGTVVSSSTSWLVVRGTDGTERTFVVDQSSTVPSSLTAGSKVSVRYQTLADGRYRASSVSSGSGSSSSSPSTGTTGERRIIRANRLMN